MSDSLPIVLVPGLLCSPRLYAEQIPALWRHGPVTIVDHRRDDSIDAIARRALASLPPRFALAGLSMGGYICLRIQALAPERVARLALLDTNPRPDMPEQSARRADMIAKVEAGGFAEIADLHFPSFVHASRRDDPELRRVVRAMARDTGPEAYVRQQRAIISRPDARPQLATIRCPSLVLVGDGDELTPPALSEEIAAGIAGANLVIVPQCGHLSTLERPEAVNAALDGWLGG